MPLKRVNAVEDVPKGHHYVILTYGSITHDDGWGGTTDTRMAEHYITTDKKEWEAEIKRLTLEKSGYGPRYGFVAFEVASLATVTLEVKVSVQ